MIDSETAQAQRQVYLLFRGPKMDTSRIAAVLDMPEATVERLLHHAMDDRGSSVARPEPERL